jgi:hypothetical protein
MAHIALPDINHAQRQRLVFIESVVLWEGIVGRPRVSNVFNVADNHITRYFALYRKAFPGNLDYDVSARAYRPGRQVRPRLTSGSAEEYLSLLRTHLESSSTAVVGSIGDNVDAATLPWPHAPMDRTILKEVTRALRQQHGLRIRYQSLSSPEPGDRDVWPHALVFAGIRWHVRVYDGKRGAFIDLNLQRFLSAKPLDAPSPKPPSADVDWREEVDIDILPAAKLTRTQQDIIAKEYGMREIGKARVWRVRLKRCLAPYFIRWLRLDLSPDESFPLVLRDQKVAKLFRFGEQ